MAISQKYDDLATYGRAARAEGESATDASTSGGGGPAEADENDAMKEFRCPNDDERWLPHAPESSVAIPASSVAPRKVP